MIQIRCSFCYIFYIVNPPADNYTFTEISVVVLNEGKATVDSDIWLNADLDVNVSTNNPKKMYVYPCYLSRFYGVHLSG